jgi:LPS sulfotransferase NodH
MAKNAHARAHQQVHVMALVAVVRTDGLVQAVCAAESHATALWTGHWCQQPATGYAVLRSPLDPVLNQVNPSVMTAI